MRSPTAGRSRVPGAVAERTAPRSGRPTGSGLPGERDDEQSDECVRFAVTGQDRRAPEPALSGERGRLVRARSRDPRARGGRSRRRSGRGGCAAVGRGGHRCRRRVQRRLGGSRVRSSTSPRRCGHGPVHAGHGRARGHSSTTRRRSGLPGGHAHRRRVRDPRTGRGRGRPCTRAEDGTCRRAAGLHPRSDQRPRTLPLLPLGSRGSLRGVPWATAPGGRLPAEAALPHVGVGFAPVEGGVTHGLAAVQPLRPLRPVPGGDTQGPHAVGDGPRPDAAGAARLCVPPDRQLRPAIELAMRLRPAATAIKLRSSSGSRSAAATASSPRSSSRRYWWARRSPALAASRTDWSAATRPPAHVAHDVRVALVDDVLRDAAHRVTPDTGPAAAGDSTRS